MKTLFLVPLVILAACDAVAELDPMAPDAIEGIARLIEPDEGGGTPPNDGSAPTYGSLAEVPGEIRFADIFVTKATLVWVGSTAKAESYIDYWGNRITQAMSLTIQNQNGGGSRHDYPAKRSHYWGGERRTWTTHLEFLTPSSCGQVGNLTVNYEVKQVVFFDWKLTTLDEDHANKYANAAQPDCPPESGSPGTKDPWSDREVDGDAYCMVFFTYDKNTGEVVDFWILYCTEKN